MQRTSLPLMRGPDHPLTCGELPSGTGDALTLGICSHGQLVIIVLRGELDIATALGLARRLEPLAETGSHLILDLAGVRFCDCAGLTTFLRLRQRATASGGSLHITEPAPAVRRLIAVTRLHDLLPIATGPAEVITNLGWDAIITPPLPPADDHARTSAPRQTRPPLRRGHPAHSAGPPAVSPRGPPKASTARGRPGVEPSRLTRSAQARAPIPGLLIHARTARTVEGPLAAGEMDRRA